MPLGSQEEIELSTNANDTNGISNNKSAFYERKRQSKAIRVLTVLAYVLSVSLAAIILSAYYVFMWEGKPSLAYQNCAPTDLAGENNNSNNTSKTVTSETLNKKQPFSESLVNPLSNLKKKKSSEEINLMLPSEIKNNIIKITDDSPNEISQPSVNFENTMYLTTPPEENSTWLPEIESDFESDYNDFKTEPIFIKKLFGYRKVKVK